MAIVLNSSLEGGSRTTSIISKSSPATHFGFFRHITNPGAGNFQTIFYWGDDPVTLYQDYVWIGVAETGRIVFDIGLNGSSSVSGNYLLPDFGLFQWAWVRNGTTSELWIDGIARVTLTFDFTQAGFTQPTHQYFGTDTFAADWNAHDQAYYREWNAALIQNEILAELNSPDFAVVKTANLIADTPFISDADDISGNSNDWTPIGSVSYTTGVLNQDSTYARPVINLPVEYSQDAHLSGTTYDLWYRYAKVANEVVMGVFGFGDLVTYTPQLQVLTGSLGSLTTYKSITGVENKPVQIPIVPEPSPNFFYFKFATNGGNPTPAVLVLSLQAPNKNIIPGGSIFINDDTQGFPGIFISSNPGTVLNFIQPFPNGEGGDRQKGSVDSSGSGIIVMEDFGNNMIETYDVNFNANTSISFANGFVRIRVTISTGLFWMGNSDNPTTVRSIDNTGALRAQIFTLTGSASINAIAANQAETILYWSNTVGNTSVKRWDLVNDIALSNFLPGFGAGWFIPDILIFEDESLIIATVQSGTGFTVYHYSAAAALLNTYVLGTEVFPSGTQPRIGYGTDDTNFWAWSHNSDGTSRWRQVQVSDGTILQDIECPEYEGGIYQKTASATPDKRFGPSFSCPFLTTPPDTPTPGIEPPNTDETIPGSPSGGAGGLYQLVPGKTDDTLWVSFPSDTTNVKKPNPTIKTGDIGQ